MPPPPREYLRNPPFLTACDLLFDTGRLSDPSRIGGCNMRTLLSTAISCGALLRCAAGPIDFTPATGKRVLENVEFPQLVFHQDGRPITYEQPRNWTFTGASAELKLTPNVAQAQASIEQVSLAGPQPFDEAAIAALRLVVLGSIPSGAKDAKIVSEEQNPVPINRQPSYAITADYSFFDQDYVISMLFANLGETQVRARLVTRKADFDKLQRAFRGSLFSLHWEEKAAAASPPHASN